MRTKIAPFFLAGTLVLTACAKKEEAKAVDSSAVASVASPVAPMPDVGKIEHVQVTTQGIGATPDAAVQAALRLAIQEVNGESIDAGSIAVKFGLDVASGQTEESLRGSAFAEAIATKSKGAISNFKLVSIIDPTANGQPYKANVEASIAKFAAPADSKKIKIVISPLHLPANEFDIGDTTVAASKIADEIRQRLIDALTTSVWRRGQPAERPGGGAPAAAGARRAGGAAAARARATARGAGGGEAGQQAAAARPARAGGRRRRAAAAAAAARPATAAGRRRDGGRGRGRWRRRRRGGRARARRDGAAASDGGERATGGAAGGRRRRRGGGGGRTTAARRLPVRGQVVLRSLGSANILKICGPLAGSALTMLAWKCMQMMAVKFSS